jgi:hypothetical protein
MSAVAADGVDSGSRGGTPDFWLPWTFRRILALPGAPLAIGAGVVLLSLAVNAAWFNASGAWQGYHVEGIPIWLHPYLSVDLSYAVTFGLGAVALFYLVRGAERDLLQLGPALELAPGALADVRREILSVPARSLRVGTVIALGIALMDVWIAFAYADLGRFGSANVAWFVIREVVCDLLIFRVFTWAAIVALRLSRLTRETARIRLFDLGALRPLAQNGVRLALFWVLLWAIWVPVLFVGPIEDVMGLLMVIVAGSGLSTVAITLPTLGARRRVGETKAAELAEVRGTIDCDRAAALDPNHPDRAAAAARLPGLLAYEARVAAVSVWLLDSHSLRRVGLYLLIPLVSWVGGAMIERLVDAALD